MRLLLATMSLICLTGGAYAQSAPEPDALQLDFRHSNATVIVGGAKASFGIVAGVLQYDPVKPQQSALAISLDTTSINLPAVKTAFEAAAFPELRIVSNGTSSGNGAMSALPVDVTIRNITKSEIFQVSYTPAANGSVDFHAEGIINGADFHLKGKSGDVPVVIDAPFIQTSSFRP